MKKLFFVFSAFLFPMDKRSNSRHMGGYYYGARYIHFDTSSANGLCNGGDCSGGSGGGSGGDCSGGGD